MIDYRLMLNYVRTVVPVLSAGALGLNLEDIIFLKHSLAQRRQTIYLCLTHDQCKVLYVLPRHIY